MSEAEFSDWAMKICLSILIVFLVFIIWNLGKESKGGKLGMIILFFVLGLGIAGFLMKEVLIRLLV